MPGIGLDTVGAPATVATGRVITAPVRAQRLAPLEQYPSIDSAEIDELLLRDVPSGVREVLHHQLARLDPGTCKPAFDARVSALIFLCPWAAEASVGHRQLVPDQVSELRRVFEHAIPGVLRGTCGRVAGL